MLVKTQCGVSRTDYRSLTSQYENSLFRHWCCANTTSCQNLLYCDFISALQSAVVADSSSSYGTVLSSQDNFGIVAPRYTVKAKIHQATSVSSQLPFVVPNKLQLHTTRILVHSSISGAIVIAITAVMHATIVLSCFVSVFIFYVSHYIQLFSHLGYKCV